MDNKTKTGEILGRLILFSLTDTLVNLLFKKMKSKPFH